MTTKRNADVDQDAIQPRLRAWAREFFKDESIRSIARGADVAPSRISDLLSGDEGLIGHHVLTRLARYARVPEHFLLELGELLPRTPELNSDTRFLIYVYEQLDEKAREEMLKHAEYLRDRDITPHPLRPKKKS